MKNVPKRLIKKIYFQYNHMFHKYLVQSLCEKIISKYYQGDSNVCRSCYGSNVTKLE